MHRKVISIATAVALATGMSIHAVADTAPEDAYDYRASIMDTMRGHIRAASMVIRGLVDDRGQLLNHAHAMANNTMEFDHLFPAGSNVGDSEALPVIWEQPEEFAAAVEKIKTATAAFVDAAEGGDSEAIGAAFRDLGGACRNCHDRFRVEHD